MTLQEAALNGAPTSRARLDRAVSLAASTELAAAGDPDVADPHLLRHWLEARLPGAGRVRVAGTLDRRLVLIERPDGRWAAADLSGMPHGDRAWPSWATGHIRVDDPGSWLSLATLDERAVYRLSRPDVLLVALYHPKHFPLPRFPLGIRDVAHAARSTLLGTVGLEDMQLGLTLPALTSRIERQAPDIPDIPATFGQHDLMTSLLDAVYATGRPPLVVAGCSLTARNEDMLLERYPRLLVARAGGEATIEALLAHWHGDIGFDQVPGLGFNGASRGSGIAIGRRRTARPVTRDTTGDIFPELDLLPAKPGLASQLDQKGGGMGQPEIDQTVSVFYRIERAGACRLSDGGGPFGFDIAVALLADELIGSYECDAIAETGCFLGDTAAYLARRYPDLPVYTCDIGPGYSAFTARRLAGCPNITVSCEDSPGMLARVSAKHKRPLAYLDAHWGEHWPLLAELDALSTGIALIHDFDIGHERFSFDTYGGLACGPQLLAMMRQPPGRYFTLDPGAALPVPCLQTGRRAGAAVISAGLSDQPLHASRYLAAHDLSAAPLRITKAAR